MEEDVENAVIEFTNYAAKIYSWVFNQLANSHPEIHKQIESVYPKKSIIICRLSGRNARHCNTHIFVWNLAGT